MCFWWKQRWVRKPRLAQVGDESVGVKPAVMTSVGYSVTIILGASQRGRRERLPLRCNTMTEAPTASSSRAAGVSNPPRGLSIIQHLSQVAFQRQEAGG